MLKRFDLPTRRTTALASTFGPTVDDAPSARPPTGKLSPASAARPVVHALITLALFAWALVGFDAARSTTAFHPDESRWIATSRYFSYLLLRPDLEHEAWKGGFLTLGQPPAFRYILGAGLWLQGHDLDTLNQPYNFQIPPEQNQREGGVPTLSVLMDARRVATLFAAAAVALLYILATLLGSRGAGVVAALLAGASPYLHEHFSRAMSDSTLA